jgi:hypothetical protein
MGRAFHQFQYHVAYSLQGYKPPAHIEEQRETFLRQVGRPATSTFLEQIATCQPWLGTTRSGYGVIRFHNQEMPIQAYAYELYYGPVPTIDPLDFKNRNRPTKMVARCVAAGTRNCVHQNHLGIIRAHTPPCPPLTLQERQAVRERFEREGGDLTVVRDLEGRGRLPLARIVRIATFLEGPNDPR